MNTSDFTSNFWNVYIAVIVLLSFVGLAWLLFSQNKAKTNQSGQNDTMGHSWDDIEEYNNPLPRWWFYLFILTMIFGAGYLFAYPGLGDYPGSLKWTSKNQYEGEVKAATAQFQPVYDKFAKMSIEQVAADPQAPRITWLRAAFDANISRTPAAITSRMLSCRSVRSKRR